MRFANHRGRPVIIDGDAVVELLDEGVPAADGVGRFDPFLHVIEGWSEQWVAERQAVGRRVALDEVALGPPVPRPGKIIGAPVNYRDHQREMNAEHTITGLGFFMKSPSSIVGPGGSVPIPFPGRRTDQEAELGVIIGRRAVDVSASEALDHVFGYTCLVDVTVRGPEERSTRKSFPGFTPLGPWIATAEDIADPSDLTIRGWVNDDLRQEATTADMVYSVPQLIEFISSVVTLEPGDVIATGTPAGVGPVVPGDRIKVAVEQVGELHVEVSDSTREPHPLWLRDQID